ncbi:uncharacterized protein LOC131952830 [Physella acuta]|uniref:uncharacterized protein LOC131952830 n=1 Tax=Physella acuta TaxID=109671 RepID=UPI0027DE1BA2|nr:uncharacterized protein LOC131952830 [Physella acuta]
MASHENSRSANHNEVMTAQYFTESECLTTDSMSYNTPKTGKTGDVSKPQGKNKQVELDEPEDDDTTYTRIRRIIRERRGLRKVPLLSLGTPATVIVFGIVVYLIYSFRTAKQL